MKTPSYMLMKDHHISIGVGETRILPAGSFVCPVEPYYLPRHIKDQPSFQYFNRQTELFCYTRFGITVIPKHLVREA